MKLTFKKEPDYREVDSFRGTNDDTTVTMEISNAECLQPILEEFQAFLKAVGFHFNGTLDIVDNSDDSEE